MPLLFKRSTSEFDLAVWHITEPETFFEETLTAPENIPNEKVRLQWYATRHLVNKLIGSPTEILKDEYGKPHLPNNEWYTSLSHTINYAAVIVSKKLEVGIDVETVHPRVERIAHKFLREDELAAIMPEERTAKLMLLWSAKEALYKLHGRKQLDFTTQLLIESFNMQTKGELKACVVANGTEQHFAVSYEFFDTQVITYVIGR